MAHADIERMRNDSVSAVHAALFGQHVWEDRFCLRELRGVPGKDWYCGWLVLRPLLTPFMSRSDRTLLTGCGDAPIALDLCNDGYEQIVCVDFAPAAVARMRRFLSAHGHVTAACACSVEDVADLSLATGTLDVILDKGCFDVLAPESVAKYFSEMLRVLTPGGRFVCVTNDPKEVLKEALEVAQGCWCLHMLDKLPHTSLLHSWWGGGEFHRTPGSVAGVGDRSDEDVCVIVLAALRPTSALPVAITAAMARATACDG